MESSSRLPTESLLLQQTLRSLCSESPWVYAVFWKILPRIFPPPKWNTGRGLLDRSNANKRNWILVWEDGFCDFAASTRRANDSSKPAAEAPISGSSTYIAAENNNPGLKPELFFKMSHEVYNYGEGLMGKVALDNGHKWVFRDPSEHDSCFVPSWHSWIDTRPRIWEAQFKSGIQTIAIIAVQEGLVQLGAMQKVTEDPNFVVLVKRKFNHLQDVQLPRPLFQRGEGFEMNVRQSRPGKDDHGSGATFGKTLERRMSWDGTAPARDFVRNDWRPGKKACLTSNKLPAVPQCFSSPYAESKSPLGSISAPVMPSMSSLEALLSKLPSVTSTSSQTVPNQRTAAASFSPLTRSLSAPRQGVWQVLEPFGLLEFAEVSSSSSRHFSDTASIFDEATDISNEDNAGAAVKEGAVDQGRSLAESLEQKRCMGHEFHDQLGVELYGTNPSSSSMDAFENLSEIGLQEDLHVSNAYNSHLID